VLKIFKESKVSRVERLGELIDPDENIKIIEQVNN